MRDCTSFRAGRSSGGRAPPVGPARRRGTHLAQRSRVSASVPPSARTVLPGGRLGKLVGVIVVLAALHFGRDLVVPLALALLLAFALTGPVTRLERFGLRRSWAVGLVAIGVLGAVLGAGWVVVTQTTTVLSELPTHRAAIHEKLAVVLEPMQKVAQAGRQMVPQDPVPESGPPVWSPGVPGSSPRWPLYTTPAEAGSAFFRGIPAAVSSLLNPIGTAGMVLLFAVFMLLNREDLRNRSLRLLSNGNLTATTQAMTEAWARIGRYLGRQTLVNGFFGAALALGLLVIGVPGWALWGLLCGMLRFLPYVGILLGISMPLAMALAMPGWEPLLGTAGLFVLLELVVYVGIEPWLYGGSAGVSPFAVLMSAALWTWLWGPIGLLLAMPLTVVLVVTSKSVPQLAFLDVLLGTDAVLTPSDRYYQRLMAHDAVEARRVLDEVGAEQPAAVHEQVLVPALAAIERDRRAGLFADDVYAALCDGVRDSVDELEASNPLVLADAAMANAAPMPGGVVCLPVSSGTHDVAAYMLSHMLRRAGLPARLISNDLTFSERLEQLAAQEIVCIVTLPDPTLRLVRALCKRVLARRPDLPIVVMAWGSADETEAWGHRTLVESTHAVAATAAELTLAVAGLRQRLLATGAVPAVPAAAAMPVLGAG
jgi:predicted PurR-regulated permease PerM